MNVLAWNPWTNAADAADVDHALTWICPIVTIGVIVFAVILLGLVLGSWK